MKLILHKDTVYETVESEYYTGHQPVEIIKGEPNLSWKGGKIPIDEWNKILAFFKWSYDETHSETQVRLLYNPTENKWAAWAFPQEHGTGMTTKEIDGVDKDNQRERFSGYIVNGTVHHHCSSSAFQSGTDKDNEQSQDGVHITIGNMNEQKYDIHARVCRSNAMYSCSYNEWFDYPEEWTTILPKKFINEAVKEVLVTPPSEPSFPEEWKSNLIKVERFKPSTTNYTGWSKPITRSNPYYGHSDFYQSQKTQFNSTNQFPVEYTDLEKKDEVIKVMKEWMYNYGDSMDIKDYLDLASLWEYIVVSDKLITLNECMEKMQVTETEFESYCEEIVQTEDENKIKTTEDEIDEGVPHYENMY